MHELNIRPQASPLRFGLDMRAVRLGIPLSWTDILKQASAELLEGFGWAASLAYYFFLAFFPASLFVGCSDRR